MPSRPKRPCLTPGCAALVDSGHCVDHVKDSQTKLSDKWRGSSTQRGYDYVWQQTRRRYLQEHPLCHDCIARGEVKLAEHVHHVKKVKEFPELRLDPSNFLGLCATDHNARTARGE